MTQELNRKLAEWAGFKLELIYSGFRWITPLGSITKFECLDDLQKIIPDFIHSLDACFKWLVPRLPAFSLIYYGNNKGFGACINYPHFESDANTPALALCLVIEKFIDQEKKA